MNSTTDSADAVLADPCASEWLKTALRTALLRDPVDAANDAMALAEFLARRADDSLADFMTPEDRRQGVHDRDPFADPAA